MNRRKILIVDDEPVNCRLLREYLAGHACCDAVLNGEDAIKMFELAHKTRNSYNMILLDIAMPDMDGLEVLEKIRAYEESSGIPLGKGVKIIMVTAIKETFMQAFKKGAEDYILKPVELDSLLRKLEEHLS
ncbi:MAG: response regulator [Candidatus Riflebacteria bacterium]